LPASTGLGAVVLLASGLAAGEVVRLAARRRRAEVRAAARARRTGLEVQMVLDNLGSGLLTVDARGVITRINPPARVMLGLDESVRRGMSLDEALGEEGEALTDLVMNALADGVPCRRAEVNVRRGGTRVPLGVNVVFLAGDDGSLEGAVVVFTDLTEVRRLQDHLRRSDRLAGVGELAASIAHELRNPLASIRGSVELLAGELDLEGHQAQLMQLILRESGRLNTIITDFLGFARLRPAHLGALDLDRFLEQVTLQLRQHITAHGGTVEVASDVEPRGLLLNADAEQLVQAFLNLGINACEAMHYEGSLRVDAGTDNGACKIRVSDSGPGLDPERVEDIFTPFVTTKQQGTGLGLPMVARIVHGHGGTVEARNNPGGGAEFVLRLPLADVEKQPSEAPSPAMAADVVAAH
jgi:PAS domain S-box-containing protein